MSNSISVAPPWEEYFRNIKDSTILWSLDKKYLNYNGAPIQLHSIDRQSLLFFKSCLFKNKSAVLVYPSSKIIISILFALESLYYRLHEERLPSGRDRLIIFSSRVELRKEIKDTFVHLRVSTMPLYVDAFPVGRITSEGAAVKITRAKNAPKILISPGPVALPNSELSKHIYGSIIEATPDLTDEQITELLKWAEENQIPFFFAVSPDPPTKSAISLISKGYPHWGWELSSLAEDCSFNGNYNQNVHMDQKQPFSTNFDEICNRASGLKKVIVPVKESKLNGLLIDLRKTSSELSKAADSPIAKEIAKRYVGCIYALEEMTCPLAYAETELGKRWGVIPVRNRLSALRSICEEARSENQLFASFAIRAADKIFEAYMYMAGKGTGGKHLIMLRIIDEALASGKSVLFVSKNEALNAALKLYLEIEKGYRIADLHDKKIDFITSSHLNKGHKESRFVDLCVLYGCPRYYQREIFSYALAGRIGILAYESEIPAIRYLQNEIDAMQKFFSTSAKISIVQSVFGVEPAISKPAVKKERSSEKTSLIFIEPQDAEMGGYTPQEIFSNFLSLDLSIDFDYSNEAEARSADRRLQGESNFIVGAKVQLERGRSIMLHADKHVQIFDQTTEKVKERVAKNLKRNDLLVLIENSTRKSLAASIISKVENLPSMMQVVVYQKAWSYYLREALEESGDDFNKVIEKLASEGAREPTSPAAIYLWINGAIIGPNDLENIRRMGKIYNKPFLIDHYEEIAGSVKRLRSIHRSLAKRLNRLIPLAGVEARQGRSENTAVDEELELYLEDFSNIVSLERVVSVEIVEKTPSGILDKIIFS